MSHTTLFNLPVQFTYFHAGSRRWRIKKDGTLASKQLLFVAAPLGTIDPWELRRQFLETEHNAEAVLNFLNRNYWDGGPFHTLEGFWVWQTQIRKLLLSRYGPRAKLNGKFDLRMISHLLGGLDVVVRWSGKLPVGEVRVNTPLEAILATVHIDKIMKVRFDVCARPDCKRIYKIRSRHERKYCRQYCAHLEDVRRDRRQMSQKMKSIKRTEEE